MASDRQSDHTIDVPSTGNHLSEASEDAFGMVTDSTRHDSAGFSRRPLLSCNPEPIPVDFELLWRLRKYLVLLGVLAVSVTYNAGLTPPGGSWTLNIDGHDAGDSVLRVGYSLRYEVFFYCNATAFAASLVLVILLLSKSVTRRNIWLRSMQFTMMLDLFSLLGAFAAGSCRAWKSSIYIWILLLAVFVYVVIHTLVSRRVIPESWPEKLRTTMDKIRSRRGGIVSSTQTSSHLEEDVEEDRKFILMLATFAATITYQAGLNPPGGFWAENQYDPLSKSYKYPPATSVLRCNYLDRYNIFISCNATSFVASLVTIILLLSPELSRHGIRSKAVIVCVVADLFGLIGAYAAGCCRSVGTSFYVVLITVVVWICFALLTAAFVYKPVADRLEKIKCLKCFDRIGRIFSLDLDRNGLRNAEQYGSHATDQHTREQDNSHATATDTPAEDSAPETENRVQNIKEDEVLVEHQHADRQKIANIEEAVPSSEQPENTTNIVHNPEDLCTDVQSVAKEAVPSSVSVNTEEAVPSSVSVNTEEAVPSSVYVTGHPSIKFQQATNTVGSMPSTDNHSADNHQVANKKQLMSPKTANIVNDMPNEQVADTKGQSSSTGERNDAVIVVGDLSAQTTPDNHCNGATNDHTVQHSDVPTGASEIEMVESNNNTVVPSENGNVDKKGGLSEDSSKKSSDHRTTSEHLKKSRTYLLLLAILAVSLTYQSGLNPPGGFWSRTENDHAAGDHILEDTHHRRYIAFFYLNAVAFVASFVMIIILLNKRMSDKGIKRFALQIAMIVDLLALTGAYVMGSSREARNSMYISLLVCLVLVYVGIHVLIAHVIPEGWKKVVAEKLKLFSCKLLWPEPHQSDQNQTGDEDGKEWERRRNLLLILAVLAVTVTYQAGINPPGGLWSDDKKVSGTAGNPILQHNRSKRYDVFYYSNSVTFVSSVVITILLVNKESCERGIKSYALRVCLVVGLVGLLIAYAAGSCRKAKESIYLIIIAVAVLFFLVIQVFILSSTHDTVGGPLSKFLEDLLKRLLSPKESKQGTVSEQQETVLEQQESSGHNEKEKRKKEKRKRHKYLMLLAVLAASITYQAGLNPPGGFWSDNSSHVAGNSVLHDIHVAGNPVLHDIHPWRYRAFFIFNGISFMTSIVVIMFLLNKSVRKKGVLLEVLHLIMILDLLALMTAFAAGSCRKFRTSMYVYGLVIAVAVYLVVAIGVASSIAKCRRLRKRNGGSVQRDPENASKTNSPVSGPRV